MAGLPGAGETFGRYDLTRRIGRGGMGVVYEATHRDLQRPVALKLLSMDLLDNEALRNRFIREAQALAAVDSPMIVPVFDAGEHDGWLYIATKLFPDGDLSDWIAEHGALSQEESVSVLVQVAEGLADAHEAGFLHRDIKPSNILLQRRADGLRAVICDFGIAFAEGSEHTKTVGVIGTLGYMAPERHEGLPATAASDVYSLGCVLYACLQGRAPWVGTDVKVAMGHLYNPVPQIPEGGDAINDVLLRALAKDPDDRFQTAAEFRTALLRLGEPEESTVIVDLTHEENLAPVAPPDLTYLLPPASTSARRPVGDTVVPPVVAVPEVAAPVEPESPLPAPTPADVAPVSDDTVVPVADATVVPEVPPQTSRPAAAAWFTRRRTAWVAAAALLVGALVTLPFVVGGDDDPADTALAAPTATPSEDDASSPPEVIDMGDGPYISSRALDMAVLYDFTIPPSSPDRVSVQYRRDEVGSTWATVYGGRQVVPTRRGGDEVCILARTSLDTGSGTRTSNTSRQCGSSKRPTLTLSLTGKCTPAAPGCTEVTMVATGLAKGTSPKVVTLSDGVPTSCTRPNGKSISCFSGKVDERGVLEVSIKWSGSALALVRVGRLSARVRVP
ncbi:serine/threonine protein kinase [Nocardioides glacieisoli]|uniref:non-specific serine/threonine protein kinase n=1 Tax=Nocardioides glacieisoli TaxID=1168730 RepID=A0A4Q2RNE3_9ACTN|nr:serine/threonine-protein kinase [Nocardioides glacieisoli]RYB89384.1 serine/threonine protein kinase [Nocardioides glacieisoli]